MTRRLAIAASAEFPDLRPDWPLLRDALGERAITATTAVWTDPTIDWAGFDLVVANGAWDNIHRPDEFLAWAEEVARRTPVVNPPSILRWNMDKRYLAALAAAGVPVVPTRWFEPGRPSAPDGPELEPELPTTEFVVKPAISGGGFQTARYGPSAPDHADARIHIAQLLQAGRTVMVQPYQSAIDTEAEVGLIFMGGRYSHAIRKEALLPVGTRPGSSLHNDEAITATRATAVQVTVAEHALEVAQRLLGPTTYARVDLVPGDDGSPALLELELLDPALFFEHHPPGAIRFAEVLEGQLD
jgi:glutathione synthase/RimK-type ligase-like ATP-grasp enzyme